jgi:RHS repeat-associated protein
MLAFILTSQISVYGQSTTNVALKGTFASSVTDGVDIFSGKLEQVFPLYNIQGRGEISEGLYLPLRNSEWQVTETSSSTNNDRTYYYYRAVQGNFADNYARAGYSTLGKVEVVTRYTGWFFMETPAVTTIKFTSSSGAITEFRDVLTNGQPYDGCKFTVYQTPNPPPSCSRGKVFKATDGSGALFVADADIYTMLFYDAFGNPVPYPAQDNLSGTIYLSNGTRLQIGGSFNNITKITDRNGNYITAEYITQPGYTLNFLKKLTDSLNREISINYGDTTQPSYFDEIVYKGFGGAERRIRINYAAVETAMLSGQTLGVSLFPGVHTRCYMLSSGAPCDPTPAGSGQGSNAVSLIVPTSIVLPNNTEYRFYYNKYLEVARVKYPTGSYDDYGYKGSKGAGDDGFLEPSLAGGGTIYRRVGSVKHFDDAGQLLSEKVFSDMPDVAGDPTPMVDYNVMVEIKNVGGATAAKSRHYFYYSPGDELIFPYVPMGFGKEHKTEVIDPGSGAILRKAEITLKQREPFPWCNGGIFTFYTCDNTTAPDAGPANDPRITEEVTTLETGQVSKKTFSYDIYNNVTDTYEYDYGSGQAGQSLLRRTHTDYVTDPNYTTYTATYLPRLPLDTWISSDADGNNKTSYIQYEYDNYVSDPHHAPLVPRSNVSGFDAGYNAGYTRRGNPTSVTKFAHAQDLTQPITSYSQFDVLGNLVKTIDPTSSVITFDYSDRFGGPNGEARGNWDTVSTPPQLSGLNTYAVATVVTNSLGAIYAQIDYSTGMVVDAEDLNGNVKTCFYSDPLDRKTQVVSANNRPDLRNQKTFVFDDIGRKVTVTSDLFAYGDNLAKGEGIYDSFGQTIETRNFEAGGYVSSRAEYDLFGRVVKASNPFRPYLNETPVWTTSEYDTLGRTVRTQAADDSEATTVYEGNVTTVTDQAGKQRRSIVNAIGQLVRVDEPNSQNDLGPINNPAQAISYAYNTNGDMVKVTQGQQSRYFLFDSLGRLLRVRQPEQETNPSLDLSDPVTGNTHWSAASTYDGNGNTLTNTDAKGTVVTNTYDAQDRPLTRTYSDTTPPVTYTYDDPNIAFSKGQLTKVSSSVSTTEYTSFDAAGKVLTHRQTTGGQVYTTSYAYNLSGDLTEETYPSGRVVRNTYNNDDRLSAVSSKSASQSAFQVYADSFAYTAWGAISDVRLGNGRWESKQFNSRLQVTRISLGNSQNAGDLLSVSYDYGEFDAGGNLQADKNSGNIARQTINFTGLAQPFVQTYKYDSLNRLSEATEMSGATQTWKQSFDYDRYGNRTSFNQQKLGEMPVTQTPAVDAASNRFSTGQGFLYDPDGNLTQDSTGRRFNFNGDNRQVEVRDANNNIVGSYYYDGNGRRVKKVTLSETTVYVYDIGGKLLAEYSTLQGGSATSYLTTDNLGSPRVVTDAAGAVVSRRDFMPFGEDLAAGTANRTTGDKFNYGLDNVRKRFTGYEKDSETGLDFAEARYYDDRYGRFTAVDPMIASGMSADPQTFNRYAYVTNNPLTATDPTGMFSDRDWYTVDPEVMFQSYDDGFNVSRPLRDTYVIRRTTITTTTVHAQDVAGRQVVMEATVTITETAVDYIDEHGTLMNSEPIKTMAVARNINDRPKQFSDLQIRTLENVAIAIVEVSREKNFDPIWALAIAAYETHLGTNPSKEKASWKRSDINPMQLSGGKAKPSKDMSDADALRFNIRGAIDLFNSNPGSLNEKLRAYGDPSNKTYDTDVVARINSIRTSQRSYTKEELIILFPQMYEPRRPRP